MFVYPAESSVRCPVCLVKKYVRLLSNTRKCSKLYLRCKKRPTILTWFCDQPYGVNKIKSTVKDLCKEAGIEGKVTNHSLRATCVSRMFDKNIPEQIIKETTGHRSECVHVYKRTSEMLQENASKTVSGSDDQKKVKIVHDSSNDESDDSKDIVFLSYEKMVENVRKTKEEMRRKMYSKNRLKARRLVNRVKKNFT